MANHKRPRISAMLLLGVVAIGALIAFKFVEFVNQRIEENDAIAGCESEGICFVTEAARSYALAHEGRLVMRDELRGWATHQTNESWSGMTGSCNKGAYIFGQVRFVTVTKSAVPYAWCPRPHGVTRKWRNVLFSDLVVRHVPELEFENLVLHAGQGNPGRFEPFCDPVPFEPAVSAPRGSVRRYK
jgi:hypothetical protein